MKNNRNGQAETLSEGQLEELFSVLQPNHKLLFAICYYTSYRVSEVLKLQRSDWIGVPRSGSVPDRIVFKAATTKTKRTRDVKIPQKLAAILAEAELLNQGYLFPGKKGSHLTRQAADLALRKACDYIGLKGVSTHSFRRTAVTKLYHSGVDLKTLQKRTGHVNLANLALYVDVPQISSGCRRGATVRQISIPVVIAIAKQEIAC